MIKTTSEQRDQIVTLLREAVACAIRRRELVAEMELILAGKEAPEILRCRAEGAISTWVDDFAMDSETAEGIDRGDVVVMVGEI